MLVPIDAYERIGADNVRLQKELESEHALAETLGHDCERLKDENTKLRELVLTIYMCSNIRCNHCDYGYGDTCSFDAESKLRELGIEVK